MTNQETQAEGENRRTVRRWFWIGILVVGSLVAAAVWFFANVALLRPASNEILKIWSHKLAKFKEKNGNYPSRLEELGLDEEWLDDAWGHRLHYIRSGDGYVLVSFGRDGKSDGTDLEKVRKPGMRYKGCTSYDDDLIVTDINWYRQCAK